MKHTISLFAVLCCVILHVPRVAAQDETPWPFDAEMENTAAYDYPPPVTAASAEKKQRMLQNLTLSGTFIPSGGHDSLGIAKFQAGATFALPGFTLPDMPQSFFLLTPRLTYTYMDWKHDTRFPDSLYNAGLSVTWIQSFNEQWSLMLNASPGWASDGRESHGAVRCPVMLGMNWQPSRTLKISFGVAYLDRSDVEVLPFGGVTWTPNDDWSIELTAPLARVARRLTAYSDARVSRWAYLGIGFDGGAWAIRSTAGRADFAMYREYSVLVGYECKRNDLLSWNFEMGLLFGREVEFEKHTQPDVKLDEAFVMRVKVAF